MVDFQYKDSYGVKDLEEIVRLLRAPGGCPWDAEQTHQSIRRNFLEEAYEAVEAIDEGSPEHLKEEVGDVLLQVALHTRMEEELGAFTFGDVCTGICKKLIFRHPLVFGVGGECTAESWEALKRREKGQTTYTATLEAVAKSLPGLWRAEKLQSKAEKAGFEWPNAQAALDKLAEELGELQSAVADDTNIKEELGDLLFAAVKVARFFHIDPEEALEGTCEKFIRRFSAVEAAVTAQGQDMKDVDVSQLMVYWNRAKHPAKDEIEETEEEKGQST